VLQSVDLRFDEVTVTDYLLESRCGRIA
jgi:hypothetical protein